MDSNFVFDLKGYTFNLKLIPRFRAAVCFGIVMPTVVLDMARTMREHPMPLLKPKVDKHTGYGSPLKNPALVRLPKRLGLVRATPWADFAIISDQL